MYILSGSVVRNLRTNQELNQQISDILALQRECQQLVLLTTRLLRLPHPEKHLPVLKFSQRWSCVTIHHHYQRI